MTMEVLFATDIMCVEIHTHTHTHTHTHIHQSNSKPVRETISK